MYIENLQTPHTGLLQEGQRQQPLVDAAMLDKARSIIASQPNNDDLRYGVVDYINQKVRQTLRYPDNGYMPTQGGEDTFDTLRNEQITNCLGYAAVGSECLEAAGINHYVSYSEGHWMLAVPNATDTRLRLVDALFKEVNQDVTEYLLRGTPQSIRAQVAAEKRGTAMLKSGCVFFPDELPRDKDYTSVLSFYGPEVGREVMHSFTTFENAVTKRNLTTATEALTQMRGIYPEVDARAPHDEIKRLVKDLCALGDFAQAAKAVDDYCVSFTPSKDARLKELEGDLLRHISKTSQDPELAERSTSAYEEALQRQRAGISGKYEGKIRAAKALAKACAQLAIAA